MKHCIRNKTQHCLGEAQKQFESVIGRVMMDLQPYHDFMDIMRDNCRVIDSMKCHMIQGPVSINGAPLLLPFLLFVQTKNTINHKKNLEGPAPPAPNLHQQNRNPKHPTTDRNSKTPNQLKYEKVRIK